ncbi:calcium dependent mitochondrial carrier protein [Beauveria bassiana ARSEF 2860]|uniref:Mitochondrial thiamine pyrophosphate carrier 1 n=1 Tax=Beauveria bassiana (strain ARSEF 2860) TaxID=655819 RepID=J5JVU8_BEAB2|nr:calcium dependent mitochondrial carrier protein [Beauveria bassiana ARSEF 2860]EJP66536.1 calcium dependent mitochondrial carrier protein [Beauveria bassiana ARSEF 2860]
MSVSTGIQEARKAFVSPEHGHDDLVELLWNCLGPSPHGDLDYNGLQRGFRRLDHREPTRNFNAIREARLLIFFFLLVAMKNADSMVKKILTEVDSNGDGKIQYQEFKNFVKRADTELMSLFRAIDKDGNGKLDKAELKAAFKTAGLTVSNKKLDCFFNDMDVNHDGYITYEEWRYFMLFMPAHEADEKLQAVLTYYDAVVNVTSEGDSVVSDDTLEGLATPMPPPSSQNTSQLYGATQPLSEYSSSSSSSSSSSNGEEAVMILMDDDAEGVADAVAKLQRRKPSDGTPIFDETTAGNVGLETRSFKLTDFAPHPGYFLAGAIAGGVSRTATAPLDRLKVYLLVNTQNRGETAVAALRRGKLLAALQNAARPFSDAIRDVYRSGGIRGFFAGNGLNVVKIMPETAIKFGSYEAAKRAFANLEGHGDSQRINTFSKFTAGGLAGMIAQFCVYPLDTLKFRLQCSTVEGGLSGVALMKQTAIKMYADGGIRAGYRGVTMGLVGMFPYSAIDMSTFEFLKKTYRTKLAKELGCHEDDVEIGNVATGIIGATSGAFGASVVYPLNVVRTRLQTQGTAMHSATYNGIWDVTQQTIQREGVRGLYKGLTPNLLKVAPALSITWVVYENSKKILGLQ